MRSTSPDSSGFGSKALAMRIGASVLAPMTSRNVPAFNEHVEFQPLDVTDPASIYALAERLASPGAP